MITIIELLEGRHWSAETKEDEALMIAFSAAMGVYSENPNKRTRKKFRQLWIKVEQNCGHILHKTAGIEREEIFNG